LKKSYDQIGKFKPRNILTVGSGIRFNTPEAMLYAARTIPEIGIVTAKSTGPLQRAGNPEPIIINPTPGIVMNAVGLTNPGAEVSAYEAKWLRENGWPSDVMLLWSIFPGGKDDSKFGGTEKDLVYVTEHLAPYVDGLEINFGCPHSCGLAAMGRDPKIVEAYTCAVAEKIKAIEMQIPVLAKLTPSAEDIGAIARAAERGGAAGIVAINTVGPVESEILSAGKGSLSGSAARDRGLECVKQITKDVDLPIIGMGGIFDAEHVRAYRKNGAYFYGVSSGVLIGRSTNHAQNLFSTIIKDLGDNTNFSAYFFQERTHMDYHKFKISSVVNIDDDLRILTFDKPCFSEPGNYVFINIPNAGEKPFSIACQAPLRIAVRKVGNFTSKLFGLKEGDTVNVRGPYGNSLEPDNLLAEDIYLVGGGTGIAPLRFLADTLADDETVIVIGGKNKDQLLFEHELNDFGELHVATDDGSKGFHGFVTDCLEELLAERKPKNPVIVNCGPEKMMYKAAQIELKYAKPSHIICSVERHMSCGVGECGKCSIGGKLACVDGTCFDFKYLSDTEFGKYKRGKYGERVVI